MSEKTTLGELAGAGVLSFGDGYRTKRAELRSTGFRIIRVADVRDGRILLDSPDFVSREFDRQIGSKRATAGDVLLTTKGTVGRVAIVPDDIEEAVYSPQLCWFRVRQSQVLAPRFLAYWLGSHEFTSQASYLQGNTDMAPYISLSDLRQAKITVPPIAAQQAIAEVLGALDDKIAANTALASAADDFLACLLERIAAGVHENMPLGEVATVNEATIKPNPGGNLRYVDIASVGIGTFEYPEIIDWSSAPSRARRAIRRGDTIWSTVRPNRRSHALNLADDPILVCSTGLAVLTPRRVGFAYLYEVTKRPEFTAYLENVAEGSAYPAVRADRFLDAPVPATSAEGVRRFESIAAPLRESVFAATEENRTLAATRDALLPALMSGKLRVRDAERVVSEAGV